MKLSHYQDDLCQTSMDWKFVFSTGNYYLWTIISPVTDMEIILILIGGYILSKLFSGGTHKSKKRKKKSGYWKSGSSYSEYDTWSRSHGDKNSLF